MTPLNVLSLFDGCGTGLLALKRAGIPVAHYYASEVDKYAIQIAKKNHPEIEHIGDVKRVWARNLPKIDLLIGGSPCQDLSVAKQNRQGLKGQRSGLFWHYVRLFRTTKPRWFLLENVASMSQADRDQITKILGVEPILINSALVSAQQRNRLYWTNISGVTQPEDKGLLLKNVLENSVTDRQKARSVIASIGRTTWREYFKKQQGTLAFTPSHLRSFGSRGKILTQESEKSPTLMAAMGGGVAETCRV